MKFAKNNGKIAGSALLTALFATAVLSTVTGVTLFIINNREHTVNHSSLWQEALVAAEAGVHQAVAQLEQSLAQNPQDKLPSTNQTFSITLPHTGESSSTASVQYTVYPSPQKVGESDRPYYRVVSTGTVSVPGTSAPSLDKRDVILRKLDLGRKDKSVSRTIEAWVKPSYNTDRALWTEGLLRLNNYKIYVDSFHSRNPLRSLPPPPLPEGSIIVDEYRGLPGTIMGQFNVAPYNILGANIATNSDFAEIANATIYGDALTNGGVVENATNVQGEVRDDFYEKMTPVYAPSWGSGTYSLGIPTVVNKKETLVTTVRNAATVRGGTKDNPGRYIVDSISLSGSNDVLTFTYGTLGNSSNVDLNKNYIEIYVRGDFTTKGGGQSSQDSGSVRIENGVNVKIWVLGNLNFSGNGLTNQNGVASSLSIYAVNAPTPTSGQTVTLAGSSRFYGTVYAPGADLKLGGGGGTNGTFVGSLVGKTVFMNGTTEIHYDEALAETGIITKFGLASWFEDTKKF